MTKLQKDKNFIERHEVIFAFAPMLAITIAIILVILLGLGVIGE